MAESKVKSYSGMPEVEDPVKEREDWLKLLTELVEDVNGWVRPDWATRVIEKSMVEPPIGEYDAPVLLMQRELDQVALEPTTRFGRGTDGVVRLYRLPYYDDVATLCRLEGDWKVHFAFPGQKASVGTRNLEPMPLTRETILTILDTIVRNAS